MTSPEGAVVVRLSQGAKVHPEPGYGMHIDASVLQERAAERHGKSGALPGPLAPD